jgi:hypothetical protein
VAPLIYVCINPTSDNRCRCPEIAGNIENILNTEHDKEQQNENERGDKNAISYDV